KSGRKNVKQIQVGVNVTGDGGVPAAHAPLDGNAAEAPTHLDNLRRLKEILPPGKLLDIADTKLDTPANLLAVAARGGQFLCGGAVPPAVATALSPPSPPVAAGGLPPQESGALASGATRPVPGLRAGGALARGGPWAEGAAELSAPLRLEPGQGAARGGHPGPAPGQGPRGLCGRRAQPEPLQLEDPRGDRAPPGGRQGEVRRGRAVRVRVDARSQGAVPLAVAAGCQGPGRVETAD